MTTKILSAIEEFESARAKATQGRAEVFRMDGDCGYFNFMLEIPEGSPDRHIIAHFDEQDNHNSKNNSAFFCEAANKATLFTQALKVAVEALDKYKHTDLSTESGVWGYVGSEAIAFKALAEIECILTEGEK